MIIIDDCSTDNSIDIIKEYTKQDDRIKLLQTLQNSSSATIPRNMGIEHANGDFIAFLDADDMWLPDKLQKQMQLTEKKDAALVYSFYEKMDKDGKRNSRIVKSPLSINYKQLLKGNVIGCLTAMYSVKKIGKVYFQKAKHEDFILWLSILREGHIAYNVPETLALYRGGRPSLSSNKFQALKWTWDIYRKYEHLSLIKSMYYFVSYVKKASIKYQI